MSARRTTKCSTAATSRGDHADCAFANRCTALLIREGEGRGQWTAVTKRNVQVGGAASVATPGRIGRASRA